MIMFSGLLIQRDSVPVWLAWIEKISIVKYAFDTLMSQQMHILPRGQAEQVQRFIQFDPTQMGRNVALLWVLTAGAPRNDPVALRPWPAKITGWLVA